MSSSRFAAAALLAALSAAPAAAQISPSPRGTAMGGAYVGLARGYEALDWNPANLALDTSPGWSLGLFQPALAGTVLGPEWGDFTLLIEDEITAQDQQEFLANVDANGLNFAGSAEVQGVALSIGPVAVGFTMVGLANANLSRELLDLYLDTRVLGDIDQDKISEYRVGDTSFRDAGYYTVSAGYGHAVSDMLGLSFPMSLGVTARLVSGRDLQRARMFEPRVDIDAQTFTIPLAAIQSKGGTGYGVDLGLAAQPRPGITVGLAVENAFQRMNWDEDLQYRYTELSAEDLGELSADEIVDQLEARPLDPSSAPLEAYILGEDFFKETWAPRVLRVGGSWENTHGTTAGVTFATTQGKGELHAGWPSYVGVGLEQKLLFLSLRGGFATGGGANLLTAGVGLDLGVAELAVSGLRAGGNEEGAAPGLTDFTAYRYQNRLQAGSGYGLSLGISINAY